MIRLRLDPISTKATTTENGACNLVSCGSWIVANLNPQMTGLLRMRTKK